MASYPGAVDYPAEPSNYIGGRARMLSHVVLHTCEDNDTNRCLETLTKPNRGYGGISVSSHYLIAPDGTIYNLVDDDDTAQHTSGHNARSIGIEVVGFANDPSTWNAAVIGSLGRLLRYVNNEYGIPLVYRESAAQPPNELGIVAHSALSNERYDPGPYFPWSAVAASAGKGAGFGAGLVLAFGLGLVLLGFRG
jgi:N-acetyl-anhydromuramyl-L-alanine amidase AmpD